MELITDKDREGKDEYCGNYVNSCVSTGICVRAKKQDGSFGPVDIAELSKESLLEWLRSHGGDNPIAENIVGVLLDWGHLH